GNLAEVERRGIAGRSGGSSNLAVVKYAAERGSQRPFADGRCESVCAAGNLGCGLGVEHGLVGGRGIDLGWAGALGPIQLRLAQRFIDFAHLSSLPGCFCDGSVEFVEYPLWVVETMNGCGSRSRSEATAWISASGTS